MGSWPFYVELRDFLSPLSAAQGLQLRQSATRKPSLASKPPPAPALLSLEEGP